MKYLLILSLFLTSFISFKNINLNVINSEKYHIDGDTVIYRRGIDISHYQGEINWSILDTSIEFIICKATEGISRIDSHFNKNWDSIPCVKGCYHFFRPQFSGIDQANLYLSVANFSIGDIRPIIDVEWTKHWDNKKMSKAYVKHLEDMVRTIHDSTGVFPIIYTSACFWDRYVDPHYDNLHHLWVADYRKRELPQIPASFPDWHIWQQNDRGVVSGICGMVDQNICKNLDSLLIYSVK